MYRTEQNKYIPDEKSSCISLRASLRGFVSRDISLSLSPSLPLSGVICVGGKEEEEQEAERDGMDQYDGRAFFGIGCRFWPGDV